MARRRADIRSIQIDQDSELVLVDAPAPPAATAELTDEEAEVAVLAADGHDVVSIAKQCGISVEVARERLDRALRELGVDDPAGIGARLFGD